MLLSHFSCLPNWCHVQVFPTSATWQRPRPSAGRISCNVLSMNFIVLFATIMCQIRQLFSSCKNSIFGVEDRQRPKASRFSRIARIIRLRQSDGQSRVEYLNSKYASYACQSDSDSIYPFSHGNSAHCHQRAGPLEFGGWVRTGAES
jgi:hypothetical protein